MVNDLLNISLLLVLLRIKLILDVLPISTCLLHIVGYSRLADIVLASDILLVLLLNDDLMANLQYVIGPQLTLLTSTSTPKRRLDIQEFLALSIL